MKKEILFSREPVADNVSSYNAPIVVVGLPRSGSSYFSDLLSQFDDSYVFDDLYLYRKARSINALGALDNQQLAELNHFLGWQVRARLKYGSFSVPEMTMADVDEMCDLLNDTYHDKKCFWFDLQREWLVRLALSQGKTEWGYKAPGDFLNMELITSVYPGVKFIFLLRNPIDMMRSYKNMPKNSQDGDPAQYHPVAYSIYWKMAVDCYRSCIAKNPDSVFLVKNEEMVADPKEMINKLSTYLSIKFSGELVERKKNTSFVEGERKDLTGLEVKICQKLAGDQLHFMQYDLRQKAVALSDIYDVLKTSCRFSIFQFKRIINNEKGGFTTIKGFLKKALPGG